MRLKGGYGTRRLNHVGICHSLDDEQHSFTQNSAVLGYSNSHTVAANKEPVTANESI